MKHSALKKVLTTISCNRNLYYERVNTQKSEKKESGILKKMVFQLFACAYIFAVLYLFCNIPTMSVISKSVKSIVSYNISFFGNDTEKIGEFKFGDIIREDSKYTDTSPLIFSKPLETVSIDFLGECVILNCEDNPLVYSCEAGEIIHITRDNNAAIIEIRHRNNTVSRYEGLKYVGVKVGQNVIKDFPIGILNGEELSFRLFENNLLIDDIDNFVNWA